jgi:nitroreductase
MAAPSANNGQPCEFVVVRRAALRRKLGEMKQWSYVCASAQAVFVVCGRESRSTHWLEDARAATENLLLAAGGLDLGAVWVAVYPTPDYEGYVRELLNIPAALRVLCLAPVSHLAESKPPRTQYDERKVHYDGY